MVINESPPYIKPRVKNNIGYITLNTNEKYNLISNMFPNSNLEGQYTLPKGKMDDIDKKNCIYTKVREFIEETKYTHPQLIELANKHYVNPKFKSFLNDERFTLRESWMGLDGIVYYCEYSVFIINSMEELILVNINIVPFQYFLDNFLVYKNCNKYYKKYIQSSNLDSQKETKFILIDDCIRLLNEHKINNNNNNNNNKCKSKDSRLMSNDIFNILALGSA